jgi:hypothetical protein
VEAQALNELHHPQQKYKSKEYNTGCSEILDEEETDDLQLPVQISPKRIWSF